MNPIESLLTLINYVRYYIQSIKNSMTKYLKSIGVLVLLFGLITASAAVKPLRDSVNLKFLDREPNNGPAPAFVDFLTEKQCKEVVEFEVSFKLRNQVELQYRTAKGEIISTDEMEAKYYPTKADYDQVASWFESQGFTVSQKFDHRLSLFVTGDITRISNKLNTIFARVSSNGTETSNAALEPDVPDWIESKIVGINGLQPFHKASKMSVGKLTPHTVGATPYFPSDIISAYNASKITQDGTGQIIAIVIDTVPVATDLTTFWTGTGVNQSMSRMQFVSLSSTSLPGASGEESLDVQWASAIAPEAIVRVYATGTLNDAALDKAYARIIQDVKTMPGLRQMSMSYGMDEVDASVSYLSSCSQFYATMTAAGISVFASSGDSGNKGQHGELTPSYPASDSYVTAVGGTSLIMNTSGVITKETVWAGSGGGISTYFAKPAWQTTSYAKRSIPDLSLPADPQYGALVILNNNIYQFGGTSWSSPVMAAFCARINQARASVGLPSIGMFASKIYNIPSCFYDVTVGSNGYSASTGYDLCTGMGSPNVEALLTALTKVTILPPVITSQPNSVSTMVGQKVVFSVTATGTGTLSYQWKKGTTNISGATTSTYTINSAQSSDVGGYFVVVTNSGGSVTSNIAMLTVASKASSPVITTQPINVSNYIGGTATFNVVANGTPVITSYQWQRLPAKTVTWGNVVNGSIYGGATTATLTVSNLQAAMNGDQFCCIVSNGYNPNAITSVVKLTVQATPPSVASLTGSVVSSSLNGVIVRLVVTPAGTGPFAYQWYQGASGVKTKPVGTNSSTYTTVALKASTSYWVSITGLGGSVNSPTLNVTIK